MVPQNIFNSASVLDHTGYSQSFSNAMWSICVHMPFQVYDSMYEYRILSHHIGFFYWSIIDLQCCVSFHCTTT